MRAERAVPAATASTAAWCHRARAVRHAAVAGVMAAGLLGCAAPAFHGVVADPPAAVAEMTLSGTTGAPFRLSEQAGRWVLLFFGYANCPDICPFTLTHLTTALRDVGPAADGVAVVFVSVDPDRDTPEALEAYAASFGPAVRAVTGTRAEIDAAVAALGARYTLNTDDAADSAAGYSVSHSGEVFVIDPAGRLRLTIPYGIGPAEIAADLRRLVGPD